MPPLGSISPPVAPPNGASACGLTQESIQAMAQGAGFVKAGMVPLPYPETGRDAQRFEDFIESGRAGGMDYLARRDPSGKLIRSAVQLPFSWAQSAVVCLASYHADAPLSIQPADNSTGWIARYAWSGRKEADGTIRPSDYHKVLLKRLKALEAAMHRQFGDFECRGYVDTGPVVERSLARAAGLGWTGKNTCLIDPRLGSWNFLAVLVTGLEVPAESVPLAVPDRCGSCRRCLDACPTHALIEPYQMDASRCISYLTIEHRGSISEDLLSGMGRQIFGCDICQDVCPWNRKAPILLENEMIREDLIPRRQLVNPSLEWLAELDVATFERLFNGSPVRRTGFLGLRRNIAIAMGNSGLSRFAPWLQRLIADSGSSQQTFDPQEIVDQKSHRQLVAVREAARWALNRIASSQNSQPANRGATSLDNTRSNQSST